MEAQTIYNPDHSGYKTDTTIIQIQEKQLSSDLLAKQRNIHDDRTSPIVPEQKQESEIVVSASTAETAPTVAPQETLTSTTAVAAPATTTTTTTTITSTTTTMPAKKRKSSGHGGLLSCFRSKKPKSGTEQQGQTTIISTDVVKQIAVSQPTAKPDEEKPTMDYAVTPDGKRIYIDVFRDRPGLDMSYKPSDFDNRFVLPIVRICFLNLSSYRSVSFTSFDYLKLTFFLDLIAFLSVNFTFYLVKTSI